MDSELEELSADDLGEGWSAAIEASVTARLSELAESDPSLERWIKPLLRAVKRRRLRLPTLSPTVHKIIQIIESPEVDLDELAEAVSGDPALASRIMGVANSSFFRGAAAVPNVREALMRMGVREARTIVVVVALRSTVLRATGLADSAARLWRHSLLSAAATQEICSELPAWESAGFLAGLVHDIGNLAILGFASELPAWQDDGAEPTEAEIETISNASHEPLGALILDSWGFPVAFREAVMHHHHPEVVEGAHADLARAIELGHRIARGLDAGWPQDPGDIDPELCNAAEGFGLSRERLADIAMEAEASFEALDKLS